MFLPVCRSWKFVPGVVKMLYNLTGSGSAPSVA